MILIEPKLLSIQVMQVIAVENEKKALLIDICYRNRLDKQDKLMEKAVWELS